MSTRKEVESAFARLGLDPVVLDNPRDADNSGWEIGRIEFDSFKDVDQLIYKINRIMDRLECVEFQADRWRQQRDEALAKIEALEKQNEMLVAENIRLMQVNQPGPSQSYWRPGRVYKGEF